ncbi:MAG: hypothetical protein EAZ92_17905 [Candidatus Kapaibacterium sp.]|nr:MAG: hypothetical protein EAZ92_17905 [Candidatus Kapabacteria bacterium]
MSQIEQSFLQTISTNKLNKSKAGKTTAREKKPTITDALSSITLTKNTMKGRVKDKCTETLLEICLKKAFFLCTFVMHFPQTLPQSLIHTGMKRKHEHNV